MRDRHSRRDRDDPLSRDLHHRGEYGKGYRRLPSSNRFGQTDTPHINRKEICPFLVRIFYAINNQNEFGDPKTLPTQEIRMHLWYIVADAGWTPL